jgi:hypothetical protein
MVALTFNVPSPDDVPEILKAIDPPSLPHFDGDARIVVGDDVAYIIDRMENE